MFIRLAKDVCEIYFKTSFHLVVAVNYGGIPVNLAVVF